MAIKSLSTTFLLLFLLLAILPTPGIGAKDTIFIRPSSPYLQSKGWKRELEFWRWKEKGARRLMIGSVAPICTYNECRACRSTSKCRAEQVPVNANDPVNSAYRYRCVCHR